MSSRKGKTLTSGQKVTLNGLIQRANLHISMRFKTPFVIVPVPTSLFASPIVRTKLLETFVKSDAWQSVSYGFYPNGRPLLILIARAEEK